jgi:hypothetical protein
MATKEIKWGQRCIAREFKAGNGVAMWLPKKDKFIGKECVVYLTHQDGSVSVAFDDESTTAIWLPSALEPIPETPSVWWPKVGEKVMHGGNIKTVKNMYSLTLQLDDGKWVGVTQISPVHTTEITPEEAVKLLEQHTGLSYKIKGV